MFNRAILAYRAWALRLAAQPSPVARVTNTMAMDEAESQLMDISENRSMLFLKPHDDETMPPISARSTASGDASCQNGLEGD